jgi:hypothetical protein
LDFGHQDPGILTAVLPATLQIATVELGLPGCGVMRWRSGNADNRIHFRTDARPMPVSRMMAGALRPAACKRFTR